MQFFLLILFHGLSIGACLNLVGFNLYHTDHPLNDFDRDCLYYFPPELGFSYQFIQYCVRFPLEETTLDYMDNDNSFTFEDLRNKEITSQQLYEWSASIDLGVQQIQDKIWIWHQILGVWIWIWICCLGLHLDLDLEVWIWVWTKSTHMVRNL